MRYTLTLLLILFISANCFADVFKSVDESGGITYSDSPSGKNTQRVDLPADTGGASLSEIPNNSDDTSSGSSDNKSSPHSLPDLQSDRKPYTTFSIKSPTDQETFQNQPVIEVDINLEPKLQKADTIQLYLDSVPLNKPIASTHFELTTIDRGTHQLFAKLLDGSSSVLKQTMVVTIYVHQASLGSANGVAK